MEDLKDLVHFDGQRLLTRMTRGFCELLALAVILVAGPIGAVAETPGIELELNGLQTTEGRCRITLLSSNRTEFDLERLIVELVLFDGDRHAIRFMRVALSALAANRSHVQAFLADELECETIANILLNNVVECRLADNAVNGCSEKIIPSSRASARFITAFPATTE